MKCKIPQHVAIIPDGNRRWAKQQGLLLFKGHEQGIKTLENLFETIFDSGIKCFSFWAASMNNLTKRPKKEVDFLNHSFATKFTQLAQEEKIHKSRIKINVFGKWQTILNQRAVKAIKKAEEATADYKNLLLNFMVAYNGINEMVEAVKTIVSTARNNPYLEISESTIKYSMWTRFLPPVDLLIRTGGEPHLSTGFMMWLIADAQLYFTDVLWPDFTPEEFKKAIRDYQARERRFGK